MVIVAGQPHCDSPSQGLTDDVPEYVNRHSQLMPCHASTACSLLVEVQFYEEFSELPIVIMMADSDNGGMFSLSSGNVQGKEVFMTAECFFSLRLVIGLLTYLTS